MKRRGGLFDDLRTPLSCESSEGGLVHPCDSNHLDQLSKKIRSLNLYAVATIGGEQYLQCIFE